MLHNTRDNVEEMGMDTQRCVRVMPIRLWLGIEPAAMNSVCQLICVSLGMPSVATLDTSMAMSAIARTD